MSYRVRTTLAAKRDARENAQFIRLEHKSPNAARRWTEGLLAAIKELSYSPERFPVIPEADDLGMPLRSFVYHSHRVIFSIEVSPRRVTVLRIYHGARKPLTTDDLAE